jgi:glycosyltransferase involved in cell wall biosynthesis
VVGPDWRMLLWENLRLPAAARDDVLLCPSYSRPVVTRGRTVVTTHDATIHIYPQFYNSRSRRFYDRLYGWSARNAARVITTTETVRQDVARCYGVPLERIRVVNLAIDDHIRPLGDDPRLAEARTRFLGADTPFFMFVGKRTARRNVGAMVEAFGELKRRESLPHRLLLIGLGSSGSDLLEQPGVIRAGYVTDEDLNLLYNAAEALIIPSTFETLSLPVMEAQAVGTPVITIDTPGLRETTGGAAYLLPRMEVPELVKAMSRVAGDPALRSELAEAGLAQAALLSWGRCADETLEVLEEAAA